jgi:feruloyl esterase
MYFSTLALILILFGLGNATYFPNNTSWSSLKDLKFSNFEIRFATPIVAGSNFTGDSPETSYNAVQTDIPAACRVAAVVQTSNSSSARFEIWLPIEGAWNSRMLVVGNGGWAGGINYVDIIAGSKQGLCSPIKTLRL